MKRLEELRISPTPWIIITYGESTESKTPTLAVVESSKENIFGGIARYPDALLAAAAPKMYDRLRQSTNEIEVAIQFIRHREIQIALQKLADDNKAVLAEAAGESEVK